MKVKTDTLTDTALDYAVALTCNTSKISVGASGQAYCFDSQGMPQHWAPSTMWQQGGPISEANFICAGYDMEWVYDPDRADPDDEPDNGDRWLAWPAGDQAQAVYGPTELVAKMRCFVTLKLGKEIDIPKEML